MYGLSPYVGWTDERTDTLKKLWADGLSASQIASQLRGVTRNAVIGKVHRLGLTGRDAPYKPGKPAGAPKQSRPKPPAPKAVPRKLIVGAAVFEAAEARPPRVVIPVTDEKPGSATILTLKPRSCRWPIGSPSDEDFTFCGCDAPDGPYCTTTLDANGRSHRDRAYQPSKPNQRASEPFQARVTARFA